ncbi:hypothetical protein QVD17_09677 [Tagetes erecta]|uniref:Uncharacterized protein n=1 Tax=Tagetes erecta TaxID=13708 RepID=A0AAD8L6F1_TARER|nr:hypothetical protein QVD17_09677 [Tagetes erecta]
MQAPSTSRLQLLLEEMAKNVCEFGMALSEDKAYEEQVVSTSAKFTKCFSICLKDSLNKAMSAKGDEEKVPDHIKDENAAKLASLMQQLLSIEEATQHVQRQVAATSKI